MKTITFDNDQAFQHFIKAWEYSHTCINYEIWMECREQEEPNGDITVLKFKKTPEGAVAVCGRLDDDSRNG